MPIFASGWTDWDVDIGQACQLRPHPRFLRRFDNLKRDPGNFQSLPVLIVISLQSTAAFWFSNALAVAERNLLWAAVFIAEYSSEQSAALPLRLAKGLAQKWCMGTAKKWHAQPGDTLWSSLEMQFLHGNNQELNGLNHGKTWFKRFFSCSFAKWMWPLLSRLAMERDCLFFECSQRAWKTKAGALQCWCLKDSFDPTQVRFEQQWPATQALMMMMMMWCNHLSLCIYIYTVQACNPPHLPPPPYVPT